MEFQKVDLYQPIESNRVGPAPIVIRAIVTPTSEYVVGGTPSVSRRAEDYVLLAALPKELQERVKVAVQALLASM